MSEDDLEKLHRNFVLASGGNYPVREENGVETVSRFRGVSTIEETKRLLTLGKTVMEIAKERDLSDGTVWTHLEKLVEQSKLTEADLKPIISSYIGWNDKYRLIYEAISKVGIEKLKPIFIETNEQFDYNEIRLARMLFILSNVNNS
jgi:hypothetical protein